DFNRAFPRNLIQNTGYTVLRPRRQRSNFRDVGRKFRSAAPCDIDDDPIGIFKRENFIVLETDQIKDHSHSLAVMATGTDFSQKTRADSDRLGYALCWSDSLKIHIDAGRNAPPGVRGKKVGGEIGAAAQIDDDPRIPG